MSGAMMSVASRTCAIDQRPSEAINVASRTCAIEPSKRDERSRSLGTTGKISPPPELAVIGFVTFLVNALQLLPIGRLDGGRVATAVLGGGQASLVNCL